VVKNKKKRKNATFAKHSQGGGAADKQPTRTMAEIKKEPQPRVREDKQRKNATFAKHSQGEVGDKQPTRTMVELEKQNQENKKNHHKNPKKK